MEFARRKSPRIWRSATSGWPGLLFLQHHRQVWPQTLRLFPSFHVGQPLPMGIKFPLRIVRAKTERQKRSWLVNAVSAHICGAKVRIPDTAEEIEKPAQVPAQQASEPAGEMVVDFSAVVVQQHAGAAETASLPSSDSSHAATPTGTDNSDTEIARPSARESISETDDPGDPISAAPDAKWYVRPPSGGQYGPRGRPHHAEVDL